MSARILFNRAHFLPRLFHPHPSLRNFSQTIPYGLQDANSFDQGDIFKKTKKRLPVLGHDKGNHPLVVITGATSTIGCAIARTLHDELHARILHVSRTAASRLRKPPNSPKHSALCREHYVDADVSTEAGWETIRREVRNLGQKVDIIVNAAGVLHRGLVVRQQPSTLSRILNVNLVAPMLSVRYLATFMRQRDQGLTDESPRDLDSISPVIINISSLLGLQGGHGAAAYAASKAGLLAASRALVSELGPWGIRVNTVCPGFIDSGMASEESLTKSFGEAAFYRLLKKIPAGRLGQPQEVAKAVLFLCSNQYANNCVINLDGGLSAMDTTWVIGPDHSTPASRLVGSRERVIPAEKGKLAKSETVTEQNDVLDTQKSEKK